MRAMFLEGAARGWGGRVAWPEGSAFFLAKEPKEDDRLRANSKFGAGHILGSWFFSIGNHTQQKNRSDAGTGAAFFCNRRSFHSGIRVVF